MNDNSSAEPNQHRIVLSALSTLRRKNKQAHEILAEELAEGFFDHHQSKGKINALANRLLETIRSKGG
jgi:hypothetical protein